jgi:hypothetical protein
MSIVANNTTISNSIIAGNQFDGVENNANQLNIYDSLISYPIMVGVGLVNGAGVSTTITNCTIASNADYGMIVQLPFGGLSNNILKNTLIYGNASGGISTSGIGAITNTVTYSLVQGVSTGTGNLDGTTVNPSFVSSLGSGFGSLVLS